MYLGYSAIIFMLDPRTFEFSAVTFLASLTVALVVATLYLWLAWWLLGRSYGAHVMGIRVAGRRGRAQPRRGQEEDVGRGLAVAHFVTGG